MIAAVVALAIIVLLLLLQREREAQRQMSREGDWRRERQMLLERIQHPERAPLITVAQEHEPTPTDGPQMALVGSIDYGEPESE